MTAAPPSYIIRVHRVSAPDADGADGTDTKTLHGGIHEGFIFSGGTNVGYKSQ